MSVTGKLKAEVDAIILERLTQVGRETVTDAINTKTYKDRTGALVASYGFGVVMHGVLVYVETDSNETADAIEREALKQYGIGLIFSNGKDYAVYVASNGFDVMHGAVLRAERLLNENK